MLIWHVNCIMICFSVLQLIKVICKLWFKGVVHVEQRGKRRGVHKFEIKISQKWRPIFLNLNYNSQAVICNKVCIICSILCTDSTLKLGCHLQACTTQCCAVQNSSTVRENSIFFLSILMLHLGSKFCKKLLKYHPGFIKIS